MPKTKAELVSYTEDEAKMLQRVASAVWNEIGFDALHSLSVARGVNPARITLTRAEVLELVLDHFTGPLKDEFRRAKLPEEQRASLLDRLRSTSQKQFNALVAPAFPYTHWGM